MKMKTNHPHILFILSCCLLAMPCFIAAVAGWVMNSSSNQNKNKYSCISHEREALLEFKHGVIDYDGSLASWGDDDDQRDCCQWDGVSCSNLTGRVIGLDLSAKNLEGSISSALGNMSDLSHLDLSYNMLQGPFPIALEKMTALSYLDLSNNHIEGPILVSIFENISALSYINLSNNQFEGPHPLCVLANVSSLSSLDLSCNGFERSGCLSNISGNLCSLEALNLFSNNMGNELSTIINALFGQCANTSLVFLELSYNQIWGSVPDTIGKFSSLEKLSISNNQLNGTISYNLGQLNMLCALDLSNNFLQGTLSHNHLLNLSMLDSLDVSYNPSLVVNISSDWIPPFQLTSISMSSCKIGPRFPKWLLTQMNKDKLDISNTRISDTIPPSFWNSLSSSLSFLNMSNNKIYGMLPKKIKSNFFILNAVVDLSSNLFEGTVPTFGKNVSLLLLNNNKLTNVTPLLCPKSNMMMENLDLSNNLLSGELPNCWTKFLGLQILRLENNNFSGNLPMSINILSSLEYLHLRNNSFSGELIRYVKSCAALTILDAGYNLFTEQIPLAIGSILRNIGILNLRNNNFHGKLPLTLCELISLQMLDLSNNNISGSIPDCIKDLKAMTNNATNPSFEIYDDYSPHVLSNSNDTAMVMWKGREFSFKNSLGLVKSINVSHNKLEGHIPSSISSLTGLVSLDLSENRLTGSIPYEIGQLRSIEFLDLSNNHLSGQIPTSLRNMNFLEILNLSYNNLSGKIPTGPQLGSFDALSYIGNPQLCGLPLPKCPGDDQAPAKAHRGDQDESSDKDGDDYFTGSCISVVLGFIIGFWGVCGTLVIKRSWRIAYFRFVDDLKDKIWRSW